MKLKNSVNPLYGASQSRLIQYVSEFRSKNQQLESPSAPGPNLLFGDDNTFDIPEHPYRLKNHSTSAGSEDDSDGGITPFVDRDHDPQQPPEVHIPLVCMGLTTFGYQQALINRVKYPTLEPGGKYDMTIYTPTFVHDNMMLPGSLANLLGKSSAEDIIHRMTPAVLPGVRALVDPESQLPCLVKTDNSRDQVQGMVIFGEGKPTRRFIHEHYTSDSRRLKLSVTIELSMPVPCSERQFPDENWRRETLSISAHVWLWSGRLTQLLATTDASVSWTLADFLEGKYAPKLPLRIDPMKMDKGEQWAPPMPDSEILW